MNRADIENQSEPRPPAGKSMMAALEWLVAKIGALLFRATDYSPAPLWESELIAPTTTAESGAPRFDSAHVTALLRKGQYFHVVGGDWTLKNLLEHLEYYMTSSRKRVVALYGHSQFLNHDAWRGFKRMTAHCLADVENASAGSYEYLDTVGWPAQGCICMYYHGRPYKSDDDTVYTSAVYFVRHRKLPWYVRSSSSRATIAYEFVLSYIGGDDTELVPVRVFVTFDAQGTPYSCEFLEQHYDHVHLPRPKRKVVVSQPRRGHVNESRTVTHVTRRWSTFEDVIKRDMVDEDKRHRWREPLSTFLPWVLNAYAQRAFTPLVVARDKWIRVSFGVPLEKAPRFFKDRGLTITNRKGRRTPIIHWVRAHHKLRDGRNIATRTHLRGERRFQWRGYQVSVVMPGLHFPLSYPEGLAAEEYERDEPRPAGMKSFAWGSTHIGKAGEGEYAPTLAEVRQEPHPYRLDKLERNDSPADR